MSAPSSSRSCARSCAAPRTSASRFPEEARKIHYEEVPARAIRGQASREEAQALADEGIEFAPLPPFLTDDTH